LALTPIIIGLIFLWGRLLFGQWYQIVGYLGVLFLILPIVAMSANLFSRGKPQEWEMLSILYCKKKAADMGLEESWDPSTLEYMRKSGEAVIVD
jgi:hypothetical protein